MKYKDHLLMEQAYSKIFENDMGFPTDWDKGFQYPYRIGSNGQEVPFQKAGKWYLVVWNQKDKKHYIYSYSDDIYYPDTYEF